MFNIKLDDIAAECRHCGKCELGKRVYHDVLSNMPLDENRQGVYMLVGGAPTNEDIEGGGIFKSATFVDFFNTLCEHTGLMRNDFYMTNVCKCCLYGTRQPSPKEIKKCSDYLTREVNAIKPNLIVSLGKISLKALTGENDIDKAHGKCIVSGKYRTRVFAMYAPTTKRLASEADRQIMVEDLDKLAALLRGN